MTSHPTLQSCSLDDGETCDVSATATVVYAADDDDSSGGRSARGVENISRKENLQTVATSAGVEATDVRSFSLVYGSVVLSLLCCSTSPRQARQANVGYDGCCDGTCDGTWTCVREALWSPRSYIFFLWFHLFFFCEHACFLRAGQIRARGKLKIFVNDLFLRLEKPMVVKLVRAQTSSRSLWSVPEICSCACVL